jgi:hypothetical protein
MRSAVNGIQAKRARAQTTTATNARYALVNEADCWLRNVSC